MILIIDILSEAALPQHTVAVDKSRFLPSFSQKCKKAEEMYYLKHGKHTRHLAGLDTDYSHVCELMNVNE